MDALAEENAGRTVQLGNDYALCTVYHKCSIVRHIWNRAKEYVLNNRTEIFMIGVGAIQFQLGLQRNTVRQTTLQTLVNGVARRVYVIVKELKNKIITRVGYREVL